VQAGGLAGGVGDMIVHRTHAWRNNIQPDRFVNTNRRQHRTGM